jgi:hypothetical protein
MEYSKLLDSDFNALIERAEELGIEVTPELAWNDALFMAHRIASEYLTTEQVGHFLVQIETISTTDFLTHMIKGTR